MSIVSVGPFTQTFYGVYLGLHGSTDTRFSMELQRTTEDLSGTPPFTWVNVGQFPPEAGGVVRHIDLLPNDGVVRSYRARHIGLGYTAGPWTDSVSASPTKVLHRRPDVPIFGGGGPGNVDIWVKSTDSIKVGSRGSSGTITKTLRIPHTAFEAGTTGSLFNKNLLYIHAANTAENNATAGAVFPPGVTITGFDALVYQGSTNDVFDVIFVRADAQSTSSVELYRHGASSFAHVGSTGWFLYNTSTLSEAVSASTSNQEHYSLRFRADPSTVTVGVRLAYVDFRYAMGNYQHAY